ncbi:amidohydrolase family protein [bacterium]|nr:amidohydrolase family protein [bacterium]
MAAPTIVDAWIQHPTRGFINHPMFASLRRWLRIDNVVVDIPHEMTLAAMDEAGVSIGVACAWHGPDGAMISNDDVAALVAAHPDRFIGLAAVDLMRPADGVAEFKSRVGGEGFRGARVLPWLWNLPPTDRRYYPLFAACCELGVPVCWQVGHTGPLRPSDPGRPIPYLEQVALDFPELVIVGGHIGHPWVTEMISCATKFENVYIDTSAYVPKRFPAALVAYMRGHGRRKVLFGSNFPMLMPARCLEGLDDLGLDDEAKALYLAGNAMRVFGIGQG